jgi:hypothetical protein
MVTHKIFCLVAVVLVLPVIFPPGTNAIQPTNTQDYQITLGQSNSQGLNVHLCLTDYSIENVPDNTFESIHVQKSGQTAEAGKPSLPTISFYAAVPQGAVADMSYSLPRTSSLLTGHMIYPAQLPKPDASLFDDPPFVINETFYALDTYYPPSVVDISEPFTIRGCQMVLVTYYPFQFNPASKTIRTTPEATVTLSFKGGSGIFIPERLRSIYFQPILDALVLNHDCLERATLQTTASAGGHRETGADLLIVAADQYYDQIQPLAQWRQDTGIQTMVVRWSEVGSTAADLRAYMTNAYTTWELPPSFLLLVGDADQVPVNYLYEDPYSGGYVGTDLWYCAVDGSDYLPDIHEGRISVEDPDQLTIVVDKILDYTKTPYMDTDWFNNILLAAYNEYGRYFVYTSDRIYNYLNPLGYNCTRQYQGGTPPGTTQGVINAINNGVAIANHRDHGAAQNDGYSYTGWSYPQFDTTNIPLLTNGRMYPVMFSMNCDSGWFDGETDSQSGNWESIGEVGLREEGKGFVAILCSTRVSYSGYNDEFDAGLFDAMWPDFDPSYPTNDSANPFHGAVYRTSQVMNYGKFWMYDKYIVPGGCSPYPWDPDYETSRVTFEEFHMQGDPTMEIRTAFPQTLNVTYPSTIPTSPSSVTVTVSCAGALVCLSQPNGIYARNLTDDTGTTVIQVNPQSREPVKIVVTAPNALPFEGTILVNGAPLAPQISGPNGKPRVSYNYTLNTTDPEGDPVYYLVNWGDNTTTGWLGPYASGIEITVNHTWHKRGTYTVKAKAKDNNSESGWTTLPVTMPLGGSWLSLLWEWMVRVADHLRHLIN